MPWIAVTQRFSRFIADLEVTADQREDALSKYANVGNALVNEYYAEAPSGGSRLVVGSWGKGTQVRPSHDLDMFFLMPPTEKARFDARAGNVQSQLLQEVRQVLASTYPQTNIRGDGQVVVVGFNTITIEVVPAFRVNDVFLIPDTNNGGRWKVADPWAEMDRIDVADRALNGNVRALAKIIKQWKRNHEVPLPSFVIEYLIADFLSTIWYGGSQSFYWFDWYVRDALSFICQRANTHLRLPGTEELFWLGDAWLSKATSAHGFAVKACEWEHADYDVTAGQEWQKIFGNRIPSKVFS